MTTGGGGPWDGGANESDFDSLFGPGSAATASAEAYDYDALNEEREAEKRRRRRGSSRGGSGSARITRKSTKKTTGRKNSTVWGMVKVSVMVRDWAKVLVMVKLSEHHFHIPILRILYRRQRLRIV